MNAALYTPEILRLAASTGNFPRLEAPDGSSEKRSPVCGSRLIVDVQTDPSGTVSAVGMTLSACALGQASAALMAQRAVGSSESQLAEARDGLRNWLSGAASHPGDWPGLMLFEAARDKPARHPAILLAFDAAVDAVRQAKG